MPSSAISSSFDLTELKNLCGKIRENDVNTSELKLTIRDLTLYSNSNDDDSSSTTTTKGNIETTTSAAAAGTTERGTDALNNESNNSIHPNETQEEAALPAAEEAAASSQLFNNRNNNHNNRNGNRTNDRIITDRRNNNFGTTLHRSNGNNDEHENNMEDLRRRRRSMGRRRGMEYRRLEQRVNRQQEIRRCRNKRNSITNNDSTTMHYYLGSLTEALFKNTIIKKVALDTTLFTIEHFGLNNFLRSRLFMAIASIQNLQCVAIVPKDNCHGDGNRNTTDKRKNSDKDSDDDYLVLHKYPQQQPVAVGLDIHGTDISEGCSNGDSGGNYDEVFASRINFFFNLISSCPNYKALMKNDNMTKEQFLNETIISICNSFTNAATTASSDDFLSSTMMTDRRNTDSDYRTEKNSQAYEISELFYWIQAKPSLLF